MGNKTKATPEEAREKGPEFEAKEPVERTDDPVRMYLSEMRSIGLLSRQGEIAIAKRRRHQARHVRGQPPRLPGV